ncbi:MAG: NAD(P)H-dependent oxidoreductase subunit E [Spirochaetota bacterium]
MPADRTTAAADTGVKDMLSRYPRSREYLIPILQALQERFGYLSRENIYQAADYLDLPESKIFGVATFYNQFKLNKPGVFRIMVCRGTACHVKGSFDLVETLKRELQIDVDYTTRDGMFSLETVACLGACSIAPVVTVNGKFHGRLNNKKVRQLIASLRREGEGSLREGGGS